jgi:predicted DNA-binding transcriptional regulator AlpA
MELQMHIKEILNEREVSEWLGVSLPTLFRHRVAGTGPNFIRLSARRVAYRRSAVEEWLNTREQSRLDGEATRHCASQTSAPSV